MTLGLWSLLLPACELAVVAAMMLRICYTRYPMLILYLLTEAVSNILTVTVPNWATVWTMSQPIRMVIRAAVLFEVFRFSCLTLTTKQRRASVGWALTIVTICWAVTMGLVRVTPFQSLMIFRQYYHMALAVAMLVMYICLRVRPVVENKEHRAYRSMMTLNMVRIFLASVFVKGGFGYLVFRYDVNTWKYVDTFMWLAMMGIVITLGYRMTSDFSSLKPELAEKRWKAVAGY